MNYGVDELLGGLSRFASTILAPWFFVIFMMDQFFDAFFGAFFGASTLPRLFGENAQTRHVVVGGVFLSHLLSLAASRARRYFFPTYPPRPRAPAASPAASDQKVGSTRRPG